jgi:predicted regulator of Ras-like GTPase activity (Roadblock/LC7/MglB family)
MASLGEHEGVEHVLLLGRVGMIIQHSGSGVLDAETVSAMVPGIASAAGGLAAAAGLGDASTVVMRLGSGVAVVDVLSPELLLAVLLRDGVGFAPLLRDLSRDRERLASLV